VTLEEVLFRVRASHYDVILSDYRMPRTTGMECFTALRAAGMLQQAGFAVDKAATSAEAIAKCRERRFRAWLGRLVRSRARKGACSMSLELILIVDDNPDNVDLARIVLEAEGWQVRAAEHAQHALEVLKTYHPSLILMDIQLPGMDGLELTRRLRATPEFDDISIVALTAYAMQRDEENAPSAGCDGYISKPIDTRTFGDAVRPYLERPGTTPALNLRQVDAIG